MQNDSFDGRMQQSTNSLNRDTREEAQEANVSIQIGMNTELFYGHGTEDRAVINWKVIVFQLVTVNRRFSVENISPWTSIPKLANGVELGE